MSAAIESVKAPVVRTLELPALTDELLCEYRGAVAEQVADLKSVEHKIDLEIERRLRERGGREIAHPKFKKIALEDEWSAYTANYGLLLEAQLLLRELGRDEDAAKVIKFIPEQTTVIAAHYEYGSPVSIAALVRKYGEESEIGKLLTTGLTRAYLGTRLKVQPKAVTP